MQSECEEKSTLDIPGNEQADALAKDAVTLDGDNQHATLAHARRMAKEDILREWREEWKRSPHQGRYAPSNRIPPSFKLRDHFEYLRREVYGRVTQCRGTRRESMS
ncbi:hypothetical protein JAAARDRAFT_341874 [Jaapia argillacea MUCL 33604]|uniref:RNase H type-1 domain-containing protein n=1 Tax=Jaapia argillacea MUCL 33604 TaxID=933084 RepID=A0A067PXQ5_9AGAM|nr:hypothetical protein JAAARDRAFT_341874 [Jaapia argillacea MUCL 33604]